MASAFDFTESSLNLPSPIYPINNLAYDEMSVSSPGTHRAILRGYAQDEKLRFMDVVSALRKELYQEYDLDNLSEDLPQTVAKDKIKSLKTRLRQTFDDSMGMDYAQEVQEIVSFPLRFHIHF